MSWVSPTGFTDAGASWNNEPNIYDNNVVTYSDSTIAAISWSNFIQLTAPAGLSTVRIRYNALRDVNIDMIDVDVELNGAWVNVYQGNFVTATWEARRFTRGRVTQARVRFRNADPANPHDARFYEFSFWLPAGSEDYPDVYVEASGVGGTWSGLTGWLYDFDVRDAGIKKVSQATINLHNEDGRFTNPASAGYLGLNREVRIHANVGVWSGVIFQGNIFGFDPDDYIQGIDVPLRSRLTVVARGKYGQRCLRETITHKYFDFGWDTDNAINDFLQFPDSTFDTQITLNLDVNPAMQSGVYPKNLDKDSLLDGVQIACEEWGYDGYFDDVNGVIRLRKYRAPRVTIPAANPAIHYILSSGLTVCQPKSDIEDVKNHVFVWGATDDAYPPDDLWTEWGVARFVPPAWTAVGCTIADVQIGGSGRIGRTFIRMTKTSALGQSGYMTLDLPTANYVNPLQTGTSGCMDMYNYFSGLGIRPQEVVCYVRASNVSPKRVLLFDDAGHVVWEQFALGGNQVIGGLWRYNREFIQFTNFGGPPPFGPTLGVLYDWQNIQKIRIAFHLGAGDGPGDWIDVDGLSVVMKNWSIDPFLYPRWNVPHIRRGSVRAFGRTVYHHTDNDISCFEQAFKEGERFLNENAFPYTRLEISKGAKVWAQPTETVLVTVLPWGISGAVYRILERTIRYSAEDKLLRTTHDVIAFDAEVSSSTIRAERTWGGMEMEGSQ